MAKIVNSRINLKLCYRLFLKYFGTKKVASVGLELINYAKKPKTVFTGRLEAFFGAESFINSSSLLKAWELDWKNLDGAINA